MTGKAVKQVDFYQLTRDPAEKILPSLAQKILGDGGHFLIVDGDDAGLDRISNALWHGKEESFLAHDRAGGTDDSLQPILLSGEVTAANGARFIALADGIWRDGALDYDRIFYIFPPERTDDARAAWRALSKREDIMCKYWRQDGGKWVVGP